jgi:hypothetical protein
MKLTSNVIKDIEIEHGTNGISLSQDGDEILMSEDQFKQFMSAELAVLRAAGNAMAEVMGDAKTIFSDASCYCPYCSGVEHVDDCEFIAALAAWEQVTK